MPHKDCACVDPSWNYRLDPSLTQAARESGLRLTRARRAVLFELCRAVSPLTHAELVTRLQDEQIDQATVYRNLMQLVEAGLVKRTELGDHLWRFNLVGPNSSSGAYFICMACGNVAVLGLEMFDHVSALSSRLALQVKEVVIKGHCAGCHEADPRDGIKRTSDCSGEE
ncbi:MAG: ferric uptake regulator, Fur family [Schlesneria sp.]|nr:ferric uptake regulator, Fur family [Schlesneria sp.]